LLFAAAGCGFEPLYAERAGASAQVGLETILIEPIADRTGQRLYNFLRDRLNPHGRPDSARYVLSVKLEEIEEELALARDKTATRANLTLIATYRLREADTETVVLEGRSRTTTSFNIISAHYATYAATEDARLRGARALSDDIRTRLALFMARSRGAS